MENTNTDARKAAKRKSGFYWVRRSKNFTIAEWNPHEEMWIYKDDFFPDGFWSEIDETPITRQSRPATLDERTDDIRQKYADALNLISELKEYAPCVGKLRDNCDYFLKGESLSEQPEDKCLFCGENFSECGHIRAEEKQPEAKPTEAEQVEKWRKRFIKNLDNAKLAEQGEYNEGFVQGITVGLAIFDEALNSLKQ